MMLYLHPMERRWDLTLKIAFANLKTTLGRANVIFMVDTDKEVSERRNAPCTHWKNGWCSMRHRLWPA